MKQSGTDQAQQYNLNRGVMKPVTPSVQSVAPGRRLPVGRAPGRSVPIPSLPPVGISPLGVSLSPGQVSQNAHSGSPHVIPWTPLVSNLQHRVGPTEKMPPWKYADESKRPPYAKSGTDFIGQPPEIRILKDKMPDVTGTTVGATVSGGGGTSGGGGGGNIGGGGGAGRLK